MENSNKNKKIEQIQLLKDKIPDKALRKEIQRVFRVKKTQGNEIFRKLFAGFSQATCKNKAPNEDKEINTSSSSNDLEAVLRECNVDKNLWEVEHYSVNKENKAVKVAGETKYEPVFNFRIRLKKKKVNLEELLKEFIDSAGEHAPRKFEYSKENKSGDCLYVLNIVDLHLAKMAFSKETLWGNWDMSITKQVYKEAVRDLMKKVPRNRIEKILLVVGSDFLHFDSGKVETTAGTRLDSDTRWSKMYNDGCQLIVETIEELSSEFPIEIMVISGNHANISEYCLGSYISAWFRNNKNVHVNNEPSVRKYYGYGKTLLGFLHNAGNMKDIPLVMFRENQSTISNYKYFEVLSGDKHTDSSLEIKGVKVRISPALCPPDFWHSQNNFVGNIQTSMGLLYNKEHGIESIIYSKPIN